MNQWNHTLAKRILKREGLDEFKPEEFKFKNPADADLISFISSVLKKSVS
jgi:hypothetical protein